MSSLLLLHFIDAEYSSNDAFNALLDDPDICGELYNKHNIEQYLYVGAYYNPNMVLRKGLWVIDVPVMPNDRQKCFFPSVNTPSIKKGPPPCMYF